MRIIVYPASLGLGGSQLNAIELAGAVQRRGHDVWVFGPRGPLCDVVDELGLPFIEAPERPRLRPSPKIMKALNAAVVEHGIDLVHGYEWPPILEGTYGPFLSHGVASVGTVMSMGVAPFIPSSLHLVVGTAQIAAAERTHREHTWLLEPPVDTDLNAPLADVTAERARFGATPEDFLVVVVSRLANELKREGILEAITAAPALAADLPLRMVIVGDGPAEDEIATAAEEANSHAGREVVILTGALPDPRPAYAAADVVFGMGSSALRAMAFAKPVLVQGERGFWELLTPETEHIFLDQGWYGVGDGTDGSTLFDKHIRRLHSDAALRDELAKYSRELVVSRFSLDRAAELQEQIYLHALADVPSRRAALREFGRPMAQVANYELRRRWQRYRGTAAADDFNALRMQPVLPTHHTHQHTGGTTS